MTLITNTMMFQVDGDSDFDAHTDLLADELIGLEAVHPQLLDSTVMTNLRDRVVEVTVTVEADDYETAEQLAASCIRSAIHAAGGHTPGWDDEVRTLARSSELIAA